MRCHEADDLLVEFLDGGLEGEAAAEVRAHLAGCPRCAARAEDLAATLALVHADVVPEPPAGTWERFAGQVREKVRRAEAAGAGGRAPAAPPRKPLWGHVSRWVQGIAFTPAAVATAAALLVAIGVARHPPGAVMSERDLALARDLEVLRTVERPEDLEVIESLPALLAVVRPS